MKNRKNIFKMRKFYYFTSFFLMLIFLSVCFIADFFANNEVIKFTADDGSYESNLYPIDTINSSEGVPYKSISEFYTWNVESDSFAAKNPTTVISSSDEKYYQNPKNDGSVNESNMEYISISSMLELLAFSRLCNKDTDTTYYEKYLTYNYILIDNLDSTGVTKNYIPVGADAQNPYSGVFNGNGYEITGLTFLPISDSTTTYATSYPTLKDKMTNYAMFCNNEGTIENFGLINSTLTFNFAATDQFYKVALVCGDNKGTIDHVYARDLRSAANKRSGLKPFGGYTVSGLVFENKSGATLSNSYVAYNAVVAGDVTDYSDFNEILYENNGTVSNLFFYNESIINISGSTITYSNGNAATRNIYGTYCKTLDLLNSNVYATNASGVKWYATVEDEFGDYASDFTSLMPTPILRGLVFDKTNAVFSIRNEKDYAFMYELFNSNANLASQDYTYQIENNIYLSTLSYARYTYKGSIASTIQGKEGSYKTVINSQEKDTIVINNVASPYPTIFYPDYEHTYVQVEGFNAFGLFGYVIGTLKNFNVVASEFGKTKNISLEVAGNNKSSFGAVCGYMDSATIENINVYGKLNFTGDAYAFIGGAVGTVTGLGTVKEVTTTGSISTNMTATKADLTGNIQGIVIGGVVGYITSATGTLNTLFNDMDITTNGIDGKNFTIGGVLGAGYTNNARNLQNEGTITLGTNSANAQYDSLYVAGVIGRHLGMLNQSRGLTNYANITVYNNSNTTYVAGTVNATPITNSSDVTTYLSSNNYKANGKYYYLASRIINGANITVANKSNTTYYTNVINVVSSECIAQLSGVYNLPYNNANTANKLALGAQTISMNIFDSFSPVVNYYGDNGAYDYLDLLTVYNLRDINYTMSDDLTTTSLNYTGVVGGTNNNINLTNVRNEGNLTFTINHALTSKLYVNGIIKTIGSNALATSVVNQGNITIDYSAMITGDVYVSGICYDNHNTSLNTNINKYNPNTLDFDSDATGALNNTINSGSIKITNNAYATDIKYDSILRQSNNQQQNIAYFYNPSYDGDYIKGNINVSGITNINYSIITNTFNIGDIFVANVCKDTGFIMDAAGIVDLNIGQYAYILNSANNGEIKAINLYNRSDNSINNSTLIRTDLTAAGIIARNDLTAELTNYNSNNVHSKQVVAFTINYGPIYAYNFNENIEGSNQEPNCKASGIVGMGLLNVVNVLNYGNIFGSETISGIFGVVYFARFQNEVNSLANQVKIANTINYGNTFILYKGYNSGDRENQAKANKTYDHNIINYSVFKDINLNYYEIDGTYYYYDNNVLRDTNQDLYTRHWDKKWIYTKYLKDYIIQTTDGYYIADGSETLASISLLDGYYKMDENGNMISQSVYDPSVRYFRKVINEDRSDFAYYAVSREVNNMSINGSIFSIINFNGSLNAKYVTIRYLINFEENVPLVGFEPNTPDNVSVDRSTMYSAYTHIDIRNNGSGQMVRDTYMKYIDENNTNYVVYSPLTDDTNKKIITVKTNSTINVTSLNPIELEELTYNGAFSKEFDFYKAITKSHTLAELEENPTDAFLSDFFQFIEYSYINDVLVDKIGWKNIAYASAANGFARSLSNVNLLLAKLSSDSKDYSTFVSDAISKTSIWTKWASGEVLKEVVNELIDSNDISNLELMLEYIFSSDSKSNVLITKDLRQKLYNMVVESVTPTILSNVLARVITYENGYSKVLADAILAEDNNEIYTFINEYLTNLSLEQIKSILSDYIAVLDDKTTEYFDYGSNLQARYDALNTMFDNIDTNYFYEKLCELLDISEATTVDDRIKMLEGYNTLSNDNKFLLYLYILNNNTNANLNTYLDAMEGEIGYYNQVIKSGYLTSSIEDTYTNISSDSASDNTTVINERVALWNYIKDTAAFKTYFYSKLSNSKYYFLATEHRNTYQSNTAPSPYGATDGDLSYYYTSVITPSTYFYGPYYSANEDGTGGSTQIKDRNGNNVNVSSPGALDVLYPSNVNESSGIKPVFISDNLSYFYGYYKKVNATNGNEVQTNKYYYYTKEDKGAYTELGTKYIQGVRDAALFLYEYGFTGANNQFCSGSVVDAAYYRGVNSNGEATTDFGGSKLKTSNAILIHGSDIIYLSDAAISAHYKKEVNDGSFEIVDANGNTYLIDGGFSIYDPDLTTTRAESGFNDANNAPGFTVGATSAFQGLVDDSSKGYTLTYRNAGDDIWGDVLIRYGRNYYFSFVDSSYHTTKRTGIYRYKSGVYQKYGEYNSRQSWFTQKPDGGNNITWTTQYIDYTKEQLLELDGVFTNFSGNPIAEDERNIINAIFNNYFCTDNTNFEYVVRKALLEKNSYNSSNISFDTVNANILGYDLTAANLTYFYAQAEDRTVLTTSLYSNWFTSSNEISGTLQYRRWYQSTQTFTYNIDLSNITFGTSWGQLVLSNYNLSISGTMTNTDISNLIADKQVNFDRTNNIITISFRVDVGGKYKDYVSIPIYITRTGNGSNTTLTSAYIFTHEIDAHAEDNTQLYNDNKPRSTIDSWMTSTNEVGGRIYVQRYYGNNLTWYTYDIDISNIELASDNKSILNYDLSINGYRGTNNTNINDDIVVKFVYYTDNVIYFSFRTYTDGINGGYWDDIDIRITITSTGNTNLKIDSPYTIDLDGNIKIGDSLIATVGRNGALNQFNGTVNANTNLYYVTNIKRTNGNKNISFEYIPYTLNTSDYIKYIDDFVLANINSTNTIDSKVPLEYLKYTGSQTVRSYLLSKATSSSTTDYKSMLILNSIGNETTYYKLIKKLLELNVLTIDEMNHILDVTITGATGTNAVIDLEHRNDSEVSFTYDTKTYSTDNEFGFTASQLEISNSTNSGLVIIAKGAGSNAYLSVTSNHTLGNRIIPSSEMKVVSTTGVVTDFDGVVSSDDIKMYIIPKESLYDMQEISNFEYDVEYYTYNSSTHIYESVGVLFPTGTAVYVYDESQIYNYRKTSATNYTNNTQLYTGLGTGPVNNTSLTYYKKSDNVSPGVTINMSNSNVILYDILNLFCYFTKEHTVTNTIYAYDAASDATKKVSGQFKKWNDIYSEISNDSIYSNAISTYDANYLLNTISGNPKLIANSYSYNTNVSVDAQFAMFDAWKEAKNDAVISTSNAIQYANYIFTEVAVTASDFNSMRDRLYIINPDQTSSTVYSKTNVSINNFVGTISDETESKYFKKLDFATYNNNVITIDRTATYSSVEHYYTIGYHIEKELVSYYGSFNNSALDSDLNNKLESSTKDATTQLITSVTTKKLNDITANYAALWISRCYNLQKATGFGKQELPDSNINRFYGTTNAAYFILGSNSLMVLDPNYGDPNGNNNNRNIAVTRYNGVYYIDTAEKYSAYSKELNSDANDPIYDVMSYTINDSSSDRIVRMIDSNSFDDFSVNIATASYNNENYTKATLDGKLGTNWYSRGSNSVKAAIDQNYFGSVFVNNDGSDVKKVMYKITYTTTFSIRYYQDDVKSLISYAYDENDYLSSNFYGSTDNHVSDDDHETDFTEILKNLLPLNTNDYAYIKADSTDFGSVNLYEASTDAKGNMEFTLTSDEVYDETKTYYKVNNAYINSIKNLILEYLNVHSNGNYTIENFYKLIVCYSNDSFADFLNGLYQEHPTNLKNIYSSLLEDMISKNGGYSFVSDYIIKYHALGLSNTDVLITAAYLASDYENQYTQVEASGNAALYYESELRKLLASFTVKIGNESGISIQYINSNGSFDNDKFDNLLKYLKLSGNNDVYGIYALASSKGIKNGDFIPDNLDLEGMDAGYLHDDTYGFALNVDVNGDVIPSANWRKYGVENAPAAYDIYDGDDDTAYADSVNYAFLIEMKQLKKSIATTLFELDLVTNLTALESSSISKYVMYSSTDLIEEVTKDVADGEKNHYSVTYYVPSSILNVIINNEKDLVISNLDISALATGYALVSSSYGEVVENTTTFNGNNFVECSTLINSNDYKGLTGSYVLLNALKVVAEDTRVFAYYDILLRPIDYSFTMKYTTTSSTNGTITENNTKATINAVGGVVALLVESPEYTRNYDTSFKPGSHYYVLDSNNKYVEATEYVVGTDYYSVFTLATEATAKANTTYYTYNTNNNRYEDANKQAGASLSGAYFVAGEAQKLPEGLDLSKFVSIVKDDQTAAVVKNAFRVSNEAGDHVVKSDGSAVVTLLIEDSLAQGDYKIKLDLYGTSKTVKLHKNANNDTSLTLYYEGNKIIDKNNISKNNNILWGTPLTKYDLESLSYLDSYELAPNANMTVTASINPTVVTTNNIEYTKFVYTISIKVTAENGSTTETYTHTLTELDPFTFSPAAPYATVFKEGVSIGNSTIDVDYKTTTTETNYIHVLDNVTKVYFNRNEGQPDYRMKYSFANIYYVVEPEGTTSEETHYGYNEYKEVVNGNNVTYVLSDSESAEKTNERVDILYQGCTIIVTSVMDTGNYVYAYKYDNFTFNDTYYEIAYNEVDITADDYTPNTYYVLSSSNYVLSTSNDFDEDETYYELGYVATQDERVDGNKTYYKLVNSVYTAASLTANTLFERIDAEERTLVFPKVEIIKNPSLNALVESATFIDGYEALGALATIINPTDSIVPFDTANNRDALNEPLYADLTAGRNTKMSVKSSDRTIEYLQDLGGGSSVNYAETTNDYYLVGTTSEANLSEYAPSIVLQDEYAMFFQFMSPKKLDEYTGAEDTTYKDSDILNDHSDNSLYLYVMFEDETGTSSVVYFVKVNLKDMQFTGIYDPNVEPGDDPVLIEDLTLRDRTYKGKELFDISIEVNETTYHVSKLNGNTNSSNTSLYMNYARETQNNRFWYVSYLVFSEDFFINGLNGKVPTASGSEVAATDADWGNRIKFYNIAIIDISNNIRFVLEVDAPEGFSTEQLNSLYLTLAYNKYTSHILTDTRQLSAYVDYTTDLYTKGEGDVYTKVTGDLDGNTDYYFLDATTGKYTKVDWSGKGTVMDTFVAQYSLQLMPTAYYTFSMNLPNGYVATYKASKANAYGADSEASEANSYLPPSSLVTQTIYITITITEGNVADSSTWGISTSTVSSVKVSPQASA